MARTDNASSRKWNAKTFLVPSIVFGVLLTASTSVFSIVSACNPPSFELKIDVTDYEPDLEAAYAKYEANKGSDLTQELTVDEMINVAFLKFQQEDQTWSRSVGKALAMGFVEQKIWTTTVADNGRYFEESLSSSPFFTMCDRMFEEGDTVTTYYGADTDYLNHPKVEMNRDDYRETMGHYVSELLFFTVSEKTLIHSPDPASKQRQTGAYKDGDRIVIEAELDPKHGTMRHQKQMKTISDLAYYPPFDYCHLTVTVDKDLNLIKMQSFESYIATMKSGISSPVAGDLTTAYYHEAAPFGFPEPDSILPDYPDSI